MNRDEPVQNEWEERNRALLDEIEDGYIELDLEGNTILVNQAFCFISFSNCPGPHPAQPKLMMNDSGPFPRERADKISIVLLIAMEGFT